MLPIQTKEEEARHAFLVELKKSLLGDQKQSLKRAYETFALPEFRRRYARDPSSRQDVSEVMQELPCYQMWSALQRAQQEIYVDSTAACVERQLDDLCDKYKMLAKSPGHSSLHLDPDIEIPRYASAVDIHCVPGGYFTELTNDDVYAGARYDIGSFIFGRGQRGPLNDVRGQTGVKLLREQMPDFNPTRILDMGCAAGMNTLPYTDAFNNAEAIAIDVSAPCLRYAHARSESLRKCVHFDQQNAEHTTFGDNSFDLIVSHILFHETSRGAMAQILRECWRLLSPGGVMLHLDVPRRLTALTPYDQFLADWDTMNNNEPFWGTFLFDIDIRSMAVDAGFSDASVQESLAQTPDELGAYYALTASKPDQ